MRAGQPPVRLLEPQGAAAGGRPRYAARRRARRRARYLRDLLLQRLVFLARAEGALAAQGQLAAHRLLAGAPHGRRLLGHGHGGLSRHARRLRRMGVAGRRRLGLEGRAAVLPQARDRHGFRRRRARQGRPGADPPHPAAGLGAAVEGGAHLRAGAADPVPRRHEHRLPRRLRLGADEQLAGQARLGGDLLSRRRDARAEESHRHQRRDRDRSRVRRPPRHRRERADRRRSEAVQRARGDPVARRHPFAGVPDAPRHRPGARTSRTPASSCAPTFRASARTSPTTPSCSSGSCRSPACVRRNRCARIR